MYTVAVTPAFRKSLRKIPVDAQRRIKAFFDEREGSIDQPAELPHWKPLQGHPGYFRLRFGAYRVGVYLDEEKHLFSLRFVGPRGDFYKRFP